MAPRKYKKPQGYRDGGRVPIGDMAIPDDAAPSAEPVAAAPEPAPAVASKPGDDALVRAAEGQRRAEELQRAPQQQTLEGYIDALPISDHKKSFLRQWPQMLQPQNATIMQRNYAAAVAAGVADDTPEMDAFLLSAVSREHREQHRSSVDGAVASTPINSLPRPPERSIEEHAQRLEHEASGIQSAMSAANSIPTAFDVPVAPPARSSIPFTAPVSRDVPSPSGKRQSSMTSITLTAEEREIARQSFTAPDMTNEQKELLYARMKRKLQQKRTDGSYPMSERN